MNGRRGVYGSVRAWLVGRVPDRLKAKETVTLLRRGLHMLSDEGIRATTGEAFTRLKGRIRYGIPLSSPASYLSLNLDYQRWLRINYPTRADIRSMQHASARFPFQPKISVLVPVYNTPATVLEACVSSVREQAYGNWELCLADDASTSHHIGPMLESFARRDPRITVSTLPANTGIAAASQRALDTSTGTFVALLDHDDELSPDALYRVVEALNEDNTLDFIYSDEDMIAANGTRIQPTFKPGWSPDLLRSMNYITHLSVFRSDVVRAVGGFRPGYDGSQDYDLILRVSDATSKIGHLPRMLYHWRKGVGSVTLDPESKPYAYESAVRALRDSIDRHDEVATIERESHGHYRIRYEVKEQPLVQVFTAAQGVALVDARYPHLRVTPSITTARISTALDPRARYVVLCTDGIVPATEAWVVGLLEHAQRRWVGAVGPTLLDEHDVVAAGGLVLGDRWPPDPAFAGWHRDEWGTNGLAQSVRNCAAVAGLVMFRRDVFETLEIDPHLSLTGLSLDASLQLRRAGYHLVCTPHVHMRTTEPLAWNTVDESRLASRWGTFLMTDPFDNPNIVITPQDVRIAHHVLDAPSRSRSERVR